MDDFLPKRRRKSSFLSVVFLIVLLYVGYRLYHLLLLPTAAFPVPYSVELKKGESVTSLANQLSAEGTLSNIFLFKVAERLLGGESHLAVGEYYFDHPTTLLDLAIRFSGRNFGVSRTRVTIPEGFTVTDIAERMSAAFHTFTPEEFTLLAQAREGYLFPDTYLFFPTVTKEEILQTMQGTFDRKTADLREQAQQSGKNWDDIVTMASVIEKEASGDSDRKIIAGILWKRIDNNIALQVDATALYAPRDERYDSYKHKGLPPTPIANPGLAALDAALNPQTSDYLYYLHDSSGSVHYASTLKEHDLNIQKYLK